MVDTGATSEFMSKACADNLGAPLTPGNYGAVQEAFGNQTKLDQKLKGATVAIRGFNKRSGVDKEAIVVKDFHIVPRTHSDYDMIVGMSFLKKAKVKIDFKQTPTELTFPQEDESEVTVREHVATPAIVQPYGPERKPPPSLATLQQEERLRKRCGYSVRLFNLIRRREDPQQLAALRAADEMPQLVMSYADMKRLRKAEAKLPNEKRSKIWLFQYLGEVDSDLEEESDISMTAVIKQVIADKEAPQSASERINTMNSGTNLEEGQDAFDRQKLEEEIISKWETKVMPADLPAGLPPLRNSPQMTIQTKEDTQPIAKYARRDTFQHTAESKKMIEELLAKGFIRPSQSPWGSPMFLVSKPDGSSRMVIDYRALNQATIRNRYPLPRVDELFDKLQGAKYFSKIDLRSGYYQIQMAEGDVAKTAFTSRHGHYEWLVMPMGLTNAPAVFMALMENIFREELDSYVTCFLDDVLIFSKTLEEHKIHVDNVLKKLHENTLYVKKSKCEFVRTEVEFLGHVVGREGIKMVQGKVDAIKQWRTPTCQKDVEQFLGLAGYYRKFIKDFSKIAAPLSELTGTPGKRKKGGNATSHTTPQIHKVFRWEDEQQKAFETLKEAVSTAPVLAIPDQNKEFKVQTDASGFATSAVLTQEFDSKWRPIAFLSKKMDQAEKNYAIRDQEWLAIIRAMDAWPHYLKGRKFIIESDHHSLQTIKKQDMDNNRQVRWQQTMSSYEFDIKYIEGAKNIIADALSRGAVEGGGSELEQEAISTIATLIEDEEYMEVIHHCIPLIVLPDPPIKIVDAGKLDPDYLKLLNLTDQELDKVHMVKRGGILYKKRGERDWSTVIPNHQQLRTYCLTLAHDSSDGGHGGTDITTAWLKDRVYWPYMDADVRKYIKGCYECQRNKPDHKGKQGLPQSISTQIYEPFECICLDFIGPLSKTPRGNDTILTVIDKLTKYVYYIPTTQTATAQEVFDLLDRYVFSERGIPKVIISDRDTRFTSNFWEGLMTLLKVELHRSTSFHPQTDGQTEQANHTIIKTLRSIIDVDQSDWDLMLRHCQGAHNDHISQATGFSPFMLNNGRFRRTRASAALEETGVAEKRIYPGAIELVKKTEAMIKQAKEQQEKAQTKQRADSKKGRREVELKVGDMALLARKNLRDTIDERQFNRVKKLGPLFYGPFEILSMDHSNTATLRLPHTWRIYSKFNTEYLKKYIDGKVEFPDRIIGNDHPGPVEVEHDPNAGGPRVLQQEDPEFEIETILAHRRHRGRDQYKVKWKGWEIEQSSWLDEDQFENARESVDKYWTQHVNTRQRQLIQQLFRIDVDLKNNNLIKQHLQVTGAEHITPGRGRKMTEEQRLEATTKQQKSAEEARTSAREQVNKNTPVGDTSQVARNLINKNGEIKMPTQRCTSNNAKGIQCSRRTQHGDKCWTHLAKEHWVRILQSTIAGAGKGLFAMKDFEIGAIIAKYTGDLIETESQNLIDGHQSAYILELSRAVSIDAARTNTAVGRMINDAHGTGKLNNCKLTCDQRTKTATVRAIRPIKKGEEFFTAYGDDYWKERKSSKKKTQPSKKVVKKKSIKKKQSIDLTNMQQIGGWWCNVNDPLSINAVMTLIKTEYKYTNSK